MDNNNRIILYTTADGTQKLEVNLQDDTVWLSLDQIAELFQRNKSTISRHIKNIFEEGELQQGATVANFATVQKEGERQIERNIDYYNLDVIISVGYRVKSLRGTHFRIWASKVLKEFMIKELLVHAGTISAETAKLKADTEYLKFQERTQHELTPVEIQFWESFEEVQKRIK